MSKNLHEPSTPRAVAANRYSGKLTQQKPYAYEWVIPVNTADCAAAQVDTPWIPCYLNTWEQPTTLEPLAVRVNADGRLQWKGYANSANATSAIAFIMPGTLGGEPDMIPPDDPGNLSYTVFVTPDDGTTISTGRAYVDSTTGEVSIVTSDAIKSFVGVGTSETLTPGNQNFIWQTNTNRNPECFDPIIFSGSDYYQIRMFEDGLYTATVRATLAPDLGYGIADVAISMYRSDLALHHSKRWTYDEAQGFNDGCFEWTFEMDGTGGSNRRIEFQIINFHATDDLTANPIRVEVHKWPGLISV